MRRSGFTLVEMIVVVFVLAALASFAAPSLVASIRSTRVRSYLNGVERLPQVGAQHAKRTGQPVELRVDEEGTFQLEQSTEDESEPVVISAVDAIPGLTPGRFVNTEGETSAGEWGVMLYPDGSSSRAGVEFTDDGLTWSLVIDDRGRGTIEKAELPELETGRWPVGDYVRRT